MKPRVRLYQTSRLLVRATPFAAIVFLLSIADIFVSGYLDSKWYYRALPSSSQAVSGELPYPVEVVENLAYAADSPQMRLLFTATQGRLWRGRLEVGPDAGPGGHTIKVFDGRRAPPDNLPPIEVQVFADRAKLNASYNSLARRCLGIAPLWIALTAFALTIAGLASSYRLSSFQEQQLAGQDIVPIARMARTKHGWEIHFALGRIQGIRPRDNLLLLDARFVPVGRIAVDRVEAHHGSALVPLNMTIAPNYWLAKAQD
jgi:hypothetical protein